MSLGPIRERDKPVTLTTRLTVFFLGALALVLVGFATALVLFTRAQLMGLARDRLEAALSTLIAAAEVKRDRVEFEADERVIMLGRGAVDAKLLWCVQDDQGRPVARSEGLLHAAAYFPPPGQLTTAQVANPSARRIEGEAYLVWRRPLLPKGSATTRAVARDPSAAARADDESFPSLVVSAAIPLGPIHAQLWRLGGTLAALTGGIFAVAVVGGRLLCRRALAPVRRMAEAARAMTSADLGARLPRAKTRDELAELGESFNALLDRLEESFERQRRFTGDAAHQLKTPLAAIMGQLEVALRKDRDAADLRLVMEKVHARAGHLERIVEALLFLARADTEAARPKPEPLELDRWLAEHLKGWSDHPRATDIRLEVEPSASYRIEAHPVLLGELIDIVLHNASQYSSPGSRIDLCLRRRREGAMLEVVDRGIGIEAANLPRVFTPFFRTGEASRRRREGLGLGLAIARRLARALGVQLRLTSQLNEGTMVQLLFPLALASASVPAAAAAPSAAAPAAVSSG